MIIIPRVIFQTFQLCRRIISDSLWVYWMDSDFWLIFGAGTAVIFVIRLTVTAGLSATIMWILHFVIKSNCSAGYFQLLFRYIISVTIPVVVMISICHLFQTDTTVNCWYTT